jgi:phosphatidylglycerophosphate synthase
MNLIINANHKISGELTATYVLDGEMIIERLLKASSSGELENIYVYVDVEERKRLYNLKDKYYFEFIDSMNIFPQSLVAETNVVYHPERLEKIFRSKNKNQKAIRRAILWVLKKKEDISYAQIMLNKRHLYPIARFYVVPLAKRIAFLFSKVNFSPNLLTFINAGIGLLICYFFLSNILFRVNCFLILLWWTLDHVDGYLARLLKRQSPLGEFLDSFLGSALWHAMHLFIALGLYFSTHLPRYLILGIFYMYGNFMYARSNALRVKIKNEISRSSISSSVSKNKKLDILKRVISLMDDTDVRIHLLSFVSFFKLPILSLIYNTIYFNFRWMINFMYAFSLH